MKTDFLKIGLDMLVHQTMERWRVPGLALAIVQGNEVLHLAGYGLRDIAGGLSVTPETLFPIASCTKAFTVMALGLLVDERKLEWDKPVKEYLPGWQMYDPVATESLTVRDMLSHRSGLPPHDWLWIGSYFNRREVLARLRYLEPSAPLRARFQYQNIMYMIASLLVNEITGVSWERFVQTRIFDMLGMKRSNFSTLITQQDPNHARPHVYREGQIHESRFWEQDGENCVTGAAGSICSCVSELTDWLSLQMNTGKVGERQFIQPQTLEAMHLPNIFIDDPDARKNFGYEFMSYGMGWFLRSHKGKMLVSHGGSVDGFGATIYFMPRHRLGVVALTNCDEGHNPVAPIISLTIFDRLLELEPSNWDGLFSPAYEEPAPVPARDLVPVTPSSRTIASYTGTYEHPGYGRVSVHLTDGRLQMSLNDRWTFEVTHTDGDTFNAHESEWDNSLKLKFTADAQGQIASIAIPLEEAVHDIIFVRKADVHG